MKFIGLFLFWALIVFACLYMVRKTPDIVYDKQHDVICNWTWWSDEPDCFRMESGRMQRVNNLHWNHEEKK